jgi:hypothetical protein
MITTAGLLQRIKFKRVFGSAAQWTLTELCGR